MRISYSLTKLTDPNPALGRIGPAGLAWNGVPIIDVAQFLRAPYATVYGRADGPEEFSFNVWRDFSDEAGVINFCATHRAALPLQADLTLVDDAAAAALVMAQAVREVRILQVQGNSVLVAYKFTGSQFVTGAVPDAPTDTDTVKAINQALTAGTVSQAIAFDAAFASIPRGINITLSAPDGGTMIGLQIRESTRTVAGFTVDFDNAVPAAGYKITGVAVL